MKIFKRALSVFLAFMMIFSSVSLLASAKLNDGNANSVEFRIEYYRNAGTDEAPDWQKTDAIKRGEQLQVRFFAESDYMAGTSQVFWLYNKKFMTLNTTGYSASGANFDMENVVNESATSIPGANQWGGYFTTATTPGGSGANDAAKMLINDGYLSTSDFTDNGWLAMYMQSGSVAAKLTDGEKNDEYLFAFIFDVLEEPSVEGEALAEEGYMYVPEAAIQDTGYGEYAFTFIGESRNGSSYTPTYEGWEQDYSYTLNDKDTISTKSKVILNAGEEGYFGKEDVKTTYIAEEIGTAVSIPVANNPTPVSATKVFKGWALADDETQTVLTDDDFAALSYGYNNINLNAVYEAAGATYNTVVVKQNADGTWPTDEEIAAINPVESASSDGTVIKASEYKAEAGFHVENTTDEITVSATETKTLTVRLARDTVKVTFDGADEISGLYGATVTAPEKTTDAGYTNSGWYTVDGEGNKTLAVEEGKEFTLPATSTDYVSDVTADKQDVTVTIKYYDTIAKEDKTATVTYEDATVTGGAVEIVEAVPAEPVEGVTYILLSDIAAKANLEHYEYAAGSEGESLKTAATADGAALTIGYEAVAYKTTFDTTVEGVEDVVIDVAYGSTVAADALPTEETLEAAKPGYEFEGWFATVDGEEVEFVPGTTVVTGEANYIAKFTANEIKITYAYAGDDIPAGEDSALPKTEETAIYGYTFSLPTVKVPNGYSLEWNVEGATKNDDGTYTVGTTDVTVTGTWSLESYTLTYYYWDSKTEADVMDEVTLTYKQDIPTDVVAEMPGYQFVEWTYYNAETDTIEAKADTMPAYDIYAVATFKQIIYTVQFIKYDIDECDFVEIDTAADYYQGMVLPTQVPATGLPENYKFFGWNDADGNKVEFALTFDFTDAEGNYVVIPADSTWTYDDVTANAVLEVFADYQIPVEFDADGGVMTVDGEQTDIATVYTRYDEFIAKDENNWNIAKEDYTFDGWDPVFENGDEILPEESSYFMALWLPNINYVFAGNVPAGVTAPATVKGAQPGVINVPEFNVAGYSYTVSYSDDALDNGDGTYDIDGAPVTVTYNWTADGDVKYTVETYLENADVTATEFDAANYTFKEKVERTGTTGADITFAEELYTGFTFEKLEPADATIGGDGLTVVKAYYSRNTINVTVTDKDGNEILDDEDQPIVPPTAETGDEIEEPTYEPDTDEPGKEFDKWVDEDGNDVEWPIIVEGDEDIVIIPTFKYTDYSVTYVTDAAGEAAPAGFELPGAAFANTAVAHYGDAVAVPAWDNDTVAGYNVTVTVEGAVEADGAYTVGEGNVVVTAKWSKDIFTVDYVTVGTAPAGYELPADVASATIGTKVDVPDWTAPDGYSLDLKVEGAKRLDDGTYEVYNSNVTVTATWTQLSGISYTVETYLENLNVTDVENLDNYTLEDTLTRSGKTGDAINFAEDLYEGFTFYKQVPADATIGGDGNTTVKVYYTRDTVKVTVKDEDGDVITDENGDPIFDEEYDYGEEIPEPGEDKQPAPTEPGTEFDKWVDEEGKDVEWPITVEGEEDIVIVPVYKKINYSVTYVTVGTAPAGYELPNDTYKNTEVAHYGDAVEVPAWNDDTVAGYNVTVEVEGAAEDGTVGEGNVVVTATWTYDEYALTYSFDASAPADAVTPAAEELYIGKVVTLATPAAVAGYTFTGWVIDGTTYAAGTTYTAGAADAEAVGSWTANEGVEYFVRRHFEVLGQDGVYGAEENLIRMTGKAGDPATYTEKVKGFTLDHILPADATIGGDGKTVIDVYYTRNTVKVTVENEDGTTNEELSGDYEYGSTIPEPKDPESTDEGKEFDEWQYEDGTSVTWPLPVDTEEPIVIKPVFYNKTYTVRFLIAADKIYTDYEKEYTGAVTEPDVDPDPTKVGMTGYTFVEWRRGSADGAAWTATDTVPVGGVDYYAYFTPNSNITYKINKYFQNVELTDWDYSLTEVETVENATAGAEVTLNLDELKVDGFTIDEANSVIKQVINGNGSTEFVVYYLRNKTTIIVDGVEEDVIFGDELTEDEVEEIIKENGTYDEGYEYTGWEDENGDPVTFPYEIPATGGKLTPVYTLKSFTVTFVDENGGEVKSETVEYKSALADVAPDYPSKDGYTPTGWYDAADGTAMPATMPAKDVTYKVGYTNATNTPYTITIYVMDLEGTYDTIITSVTNYGTTGEIARIEPSAKTGLYEDTTHPDRVLSAKIEADGSTELRIYYARTKYTVTYDSGTPIDVYYGAAIPAPEADPVAPAKGKEFVNWTDKDGNEPSDYASMPAGNLEFTSNWTDAEYTITYVVNGTVTTEKYKYNEVIETPETPNIPGMNFTGWICDGVAGIPETMPDKDIVVVAQFGTAYYTVTFLDDVDGAVFDEFTVLYGAAITLPATQPTKDHYTFVKWSNVPETMPAENIVIVPEFERVPVELVPMDGSTTKIDYDAKIITGLRTNLSDTVLREQFLKVNGDGYIVINTCDEKTGFYGTGATVDLYDNVTGKLLATYTIVVYGDINGDSRINSTDSSMITSEINMTDASKLWSIEGLATYDQYKVMAANINGDNHINTTDKDTITNATLGSVRIDQVTREVIRAEA